MNKIKYVFWDLFILIIILLPLIILVSLDTIDIYVFIGMIIALYVVNIIFITYIFISKFQEEEKISWIFFLIAFPFITHMIFLLFKFRYNYVVNKKHYEKEKKEIEIIENNNKNNLPIVENLNNCQLNNISKYLKNNFYKCKIDVFKHGFDAYEKIINDLENAKESIKIQMYIIKPSEIYERFKNVLIKKAQEGVKVYLIIDDFGTWLLTQKELNYLMSKKINLFVFNKVYFPFVNSSTNNRLHRKFIIIDQKIVHTGGINISDEYASFNSFYGYWMDLNLRLEGDIAYEYEKIFWEDWKIFNKKNSNNLSFPIFKKSFYEQKENDKILVFKNDPFFNQSKIQSFLLNSINNSFETINIATPYFVPNKILLTSFINALKRGVKINIFIPGKPDKKLVYSATKFYLNQLKKFGAKVFVIENMFLHSKFGIFDQKICYIGTNNFDMRSIFSNFEIVNIIDSKKTILELSTLLNEYKNFCYELKPDKIKLRIYYYLKRFFILLTTPLM